MVLVCFIPYNDIWRKYYWALNKKIKSMGMVLKYCMKHSSGKQKGKRCLRNLLRILLFSRKWAIPRKIAMPMIIQGNTFVFLDEFEIILHKNENWSNGSCISFHFCFLEANNASGYINILGVFTQNRFLFIY